MSKPDMMRPTVLDEVAILRREIDHLVDRIVQLEGHMLTLVKDENFVEMKRRLIEWEKEMENGI